MKKVVSYEVASRLVVMLSAVLGVERGERYAELVCNTVVVEGSNESKDSTQVDASAYHYLESLHQLIDFIAQEKSRRPIKTWTFPTDSGRVKILEEEKGVFTFQSQLSGHPWVAYDVGARYSLLGAFMALPELDPVFIKSKANCANAEFKGHTSVTHAFIESGFKHIGV